MAFGAPKWSKKAPESTKNLEKSEKNAINQKKHKKDNDIIVADEWYHYYRKCANNLKKILAIFDSPLFNKNSEEVFLEKQTRSIINGNTFLP